MTKDELHKFFEETLAHILELKKSKSRDYADDDDALWNVHDVALDTRLYPEKVVQVFMMKHWGVIQRVINENNFVPSEPLDGRIDDMIVYLIILKAMLSERRQVESNIPRAPAPVRLAGHRDVDVERSA
jgi:hypothetical protein